MSTEADPKPAQSLDESVESLLNEMSQTAERLNAELEASKANAQPAPPVEAPLGELAAAVDEMVKEVAAAVSPTAMPPVADAPEPAERADETPDYELTPSTAAEAASTESDEEDRGVESLASDAFASLSDELLAGLDRDGPTIVVGNAPATGAAGVTGGSRDGFASLTDELLTGLGEPKPVVAEETAAKKERTPKPEEVVVATVAHQASAPPPPPPPVEEPQHTTTAARRVLHAAGHAAGQVASKAEPHALRAVAKISSPLQSKPQAFRDTLGWLGVYTLFVGLTLMVYVRFIHKTPSPEPAHPGVKLADRNAHKGAAGEVMRSPESHGDPHGDAHGAAEHGGDAHGKPADAKDAHGKKDDGHGAKKDDGAKKGTAKGGAAPKLPTPQFKAGPAKAKKDAKPDAKKDAKKDAGHGGGH